MKGPSTVTCQHTTSSGQGHVLWALASRSTGALGLALDFAVCVPPATQLRGPSRQE